MGKVTMAERIDIFFAPYDSKTSQQVLDTAIQTIRRHPNTVRISLGEAVLRCVPEVDSTNIDHAVDAIISAISPLVKIVNRQ